MFFSWRRFLGLLSSRQSAIQAIDRTVRELKRNHRIKGDDADKFAALVKMHLEWADNFGMDECVKARNGTLVMPGDAWSVRSACIARAIW